MKFAVTLLVAIAAVVMRTRIASKLCRPAVESELDDIPAFAFEVHLDDRIDGHVFALEEIGNGVAIGAFEDAGDFAFGQVAEGALAHNHGAEWVPLLFREYGIREPDLSRVEYYKLLDEFF